MTQRIVAASNETYLGTTGAWTGLHVKAIRKQIGIPESIRPMLAIDIDHRARDLQIRGPGGEMIGYLPGEVKVFDSTSPDALIAAAKRQPGMRDLAKMAEALPKRNVASTAPGSGGDQVTTDMMSCFHHSGLEEGFVERVRRARSPETRHLAEAAGIQIKAERASFVNPTVASFCGGVGSAMAKRHGIIQANSLAQLDMAEAERQLIGFLPALSDQGDYQTVILNCVSTLGEIILSMREPNLVRLRLADGSFLRPQISPYTSIWVIGRDSDCHSLSRDSAIATAAALVSRLTDQPECRTTMTSWVQDAGSDRSRNFSHLGPTVFCRWGVFVSQVDAEWILKRIGSHIRRQLAQKARLGI